MCVLNQVNIKKQNKWKNSKTNNLTKSHMRTKSYKMFTFRPLSHNYFQFENYTKIMRRTLFSACIAMYYLLLNSIPGR